MESQNKCASLIAQLIKKKKIHLQCGRPWSISWVRKICWRKDRLPIPLFLGFPCGSAGKESICNVGDLGLIPGLGRYPGEGNGNPLQYSGLENSMDWIVYRVTKSQTWLSYSHFIHFRINTKFLVMFPNYFLSNTHYLAERCSKLIEQLNNLYHRPGR